MQGAAEVGAEAVVEAVVHHQVQLCTRHPLSRRRVLLVTVAVAALVHLDPHCKHPHR